jgi:GxxExxY protein
MLLHARITEAVIGAAIEVHKTLGPGLLENAYEECLCYELGARNWMRSPSRSTRTVQGSEP